MFKKDSSLFFCKIYLVSNFESTQLLFVHASQSELNQLHIYIIQTFLISDVTDNQAMIPVILVLVGYFQGYLSYLPTPPLG